MTLRRIFGLMLLFLFFEAVIAVVTAVFFEQVNVMLACLCMTTLAIATWLAIFFLGRIVSRRPAKPAGPSKVLISLESKSSPADDSFVLDFTSLLNEANRRLQSLTGGQANRVAPTVNALPLYLVVGAEGSGKTTAIINSGIEPRLLAGDAMKDGHVLPTSTANFWYAEGAVFVEMSGSLLTEDSTRWEKALRILGEMKARPWWKRVLEGNAPKSSNLRGVLITCETDIFLQANDPRRPGVLARNINERLQIAQTIMRADFPAYVIFTKLDSIPNFQELFAHLTDTEASQVFGVTLPAGAGSAAHREAYGDRESSRITKLFDRLYQSVGDKRLAMLAREDSMEKRARAYEFPRELKKIHSDLVQFLVDVFRPSSLAPAGRLRGFYFTAKRLVPSRDMSHPVDAMDTVSFRPVMGATTIFAVTPSSIRDLSVHDSVSYGRSQPKWTFLTDVFRQVILPDRAGHHAGAPLRAGDSRHLQIAFGAIGTLSLLISVLWGASWRQNHHLLTQVKAAVLKTGDAPARIPLESLRELELLRQQIVDLQPGGGRLGLSYHWGLYSGAAATVDLDRLYYARFRQVVLDPALQGMTERFLQLRDNANPDSDTYNDLKAYRTITSGSCPTDDSLVASTLIRVWNDSLSHDGEDETLAERQIRLYATRLKSADPFSRAIPENSEAVLRAQSYLRDLTGTEKILQSLVDHIQRDSTEGLSTYASNYSQVLTGPDKVDPQFTSAGWSQVLTQIRQHKLMSEGEPCVVGGSEKGGGTADTAMEAQVQKLYIDNYFQFWNSFFEAHHVAEFSGSIDAAQKLRTLADNNRSPLLALIYMTSANTNVSAPGGLRERTSDVVKGAGTFLEKAWKGIGGSPTNAAAAQIAPQQDGDSVRPAFASLHIMVDPAARDKWLNDKNQPYIKALGDMSDALLALPPEIHSDVPAETQQLQQARASVAAAETALHSLAGNFPNGPRGIDVELVNLLREPIEHARRVLNAVRIAEPVHPGPAPAVAPPPPPGPVIDPTLKPAMEHLNAAAVRLCSAEAPLTHKFPFDATSTSDISMDELNQLLQPGSGAYPMFSNLPESLRAYNHSGRVWAQKPEFPALFSQSFIHTLNGFGEVHDSVYGAVGDVAHVEFTVTVDGTGKIPFQLEVDGHILKHSPGHPTPPLHLVWPPITTGPAQLTIMSGWRKKGGIQTGVWTGPWALFHLLQSADDQSGNVFTFRTVEFARSLNPLTNGKGTPGTIQIRIDSPAGNIFGRGYFSKMRCSEDWAVRQQGPGN
jgi:type VI secretion system protein ImpL